MKYKEFSLYTLILLIMVAVLLYEVFKSEEQYIYSEIIKIRSQYSDISVLMPVEVVNTNSVLRIEKIKQVEMIPLIYEEHALEPPLKNNIKTKPQSLIRLDKISRFEVSHITSGALIKARALSNNGYWMEVVNLLKETCRVMIEPTGCYYHLAVAYDHEGQLEAAIKNYRRVLQTMEINNKQIELQNVENRLLYLTWKKNDREATDTSRTHY